MAKRLIRRLYPPMHYVVVLIEFGVDRDKVTNV